MKLSLYYMYLCRVQQAGLPLLQRGGKSGQRRAPYFLTGRHHAWVTESATENNRLAEFSAGKGENVG